jgi:hypothetical protein
VYKSRTNSRRLCYCCRTEWLTYGIAIVVLHHAQCHCTRACHTPSALLQWTGRLFLNLLPNGEDLLLSRSRPSKSKLLESEDPCTTLLKDQVIIRNPTLTCWKLVDMLLLLCFGFFCSFFVIQWIQNQNPSFMPILAKSLKDATKIVLCALRLVDHSVVVVDFAQKTILSWHILSFQWWCHWPRGKNSWFWAILVSLWREDVFDRLFLFNHMRFALWYQE